jgi:hypothetical protein
MFSLSNARMETEVGPTHAAVPGTQGHAAGAPGQRIAEQPAARPVGEVDSSPVVFMTHSTRP